MYKLIALDMDGTLLNRHKVITNEVRDEIKRILGKNVHVALSTGRFPASVWLHSQALGLHGPQVALNGSIILDAKTGEPLDTTPIDKDLIVKIHEFARSNGAYVHFYGYNILFVEEINDINRRWDIANVVVDPEKELTPEHYQDQMKYFTIQEVGDFETFLQTNERPIFKATVICEHPDRTEELYQQIIKWSSLNVTRTGKRRFDINAFGVSKKSALEKVSTMLKIKSEEVVAIGDFDNDIEMIRWAGMGVAMENGNDAIKAVANDMTCSNDDGGVAKAIKKYFL